MFCCLPTPYLLSAGSNTRSSLCCQICLRRLFFCVSLYHVWSTCLCYFFIFWESCRICGARLVFFPIFISFVFLLGLLFPDGRAHGDFLGFGEVCCFCYLGFVVNLPPRAVVRFALIRVYFALFLWFLVLVEARWIHGGNGALDVV